MSRARLPLAAAVAALVLGLSLGACSKRSPRPAPRQATPIAAAITPHEVVSLTTQSADVERLASGGDVVLWEGTACNTGDQVIARLVVGVSALRADGAVIGADLIDVIGVGAAIGWLHPGFCAPVAPHSQSVLDEAPASLAVGVAEIGRVDEPPAPRTPLPFAWVPAPAPGVAVEVSAAWCGGVAIQPSSDRRAFDCMIGVQNRGSAPLPSPTVDLVFLDDAGAEVDRIHARPAAAITIDPGAGVEYVAARAVAAHARTAVELRPRDRAD